MRIIEILILITFICCSTFVVGCVTAKLSGTGINATDATKDFSLQANSFNSEVSISAPHPN